jgi:hypothetical protein
VQVQVLTRKCKWKSLVQVKVKSDHQLAGTCTKSSEVLAADVTDFLPREPHAQRAGEPHDPTCDFSSETDKDPERVSSDAQRPRPDERLTRFATSKARASAGRAARRSRAEN